MLFFLSKGYRVIAFDRRGQGRSTQTDIGHDMDTFASDTADLVAALDLKNAVHIGHSTGGGVVARYVATAEPGRVSKAVLIGAITPILGRTSPTRPASRSKCLTASRSPSPQNRAEFYREIPSGPFYGFNRDGAESQRRPDPELVAPGHAGQRKGAARHDHRLLGNGLHRRPESRSRCPSSSFMAATTRSCRWTKPPAGRPSSCRTAPEESMTACRTACSRRTRT